MWFTRKKAMRTRTQPSPLQIPWREPKTAEEHLILFATLAEAITSISGYDHIWIGVNYKWGPNITDTVELCYYNADELSVYANTEPAAYMRRLVQKQSSKNALCSFEFPNSSGGAPIHFRANDSVLEYIRPFAPHAYADVKLSHMDSTIVRFKKHELQLQYLPDRIASTIMKYYEFCASAL